MILALDTATTTGWAAGPVGSNPPLLTWGSRSFGGSGKSNGEVGSTFRHWLQHRCYELKPTIIVFESPYIPRPKPGDDARFQYNAATLRRLLGLVNDVEEVAWEMRIECREATTSEFTKFLTGKGRWRDRADKKTAVMVACAYHGWEVDKDDNAGDALALWSYAESIISPRACDHRKRLAADRHREMHGEGPLFTIPETPSAPRRQPRGARKPSDREMSLWPDTAEI